MNRKLIYQFAGVSMIVGSFFVAARAVGGFITIIYFLAATDFRAVDKSLGASLEASLMATQIPAAISGVTSFLILFYAGRWMVKGPRMIEKWIEEGQVCHMAETSDVKQPSEHAMDVNRS